jgi:hypothetical protein
MTDFDTKFELVWSKYPRRVAKKAAKQAIARALQRVSLDTIMTALEWQCEQPNWKERDDMGVLRHVPHLATWANGDRWEDERPIKPNTNAIMPLGPGPTCGECVEGWRENDMMQVVRCPCRSKRRTA